MAVINFPDSPSDGDTQDVGGITYTYSSSKGYWTAAASGGGGGGGASVTTDDVAPSSPSDGDLWWDSDGGKMYVYYDDGASSQWVSVSVPGATGSTGPAGPAGADGVDATSTLAELTDVDTSTNAPTTGQLLQWNGTNWVPYTHTNGITEIDVWRITNNQTSDAVPITGTWERDHTDWSVTGTGMTESSGIFTFPSTGVWRIMYHGRLYVNNTDSITGLLKYTVDNSTYNIGAEMNFSEQLSTSTGLYPSINCEYIFNVTNTSTHKVNFTIQGLDTNNYMIGDGDANRSFVSFLRLGDNP